MKYIHFIRYHLVMLVLRDEVFVFSQIAPSHAGIEG